MSTERQNLLANGPQSHYQPPQQNTGPNPYTQQNTGPSPYASPSGPTSPSPYNNSSPYNNNTTGGSPYDNSHPVKDGQGQAPPSYANYTSATYRSNDHSLPDNWESYRDPKTQSVYYCNMQTMQTTWAHPSTGVVADNSIPGYEVPDYYAQVAQRQAEMEKETFAPQRPNFNPESSTVPFDANSQYSPYYYAAQIQKTIDPNVLNQAQLDSISPRYLDSAKYSQNLTCKQRVCGTMGKNKTLTIFSLILWAGIAVAIFLGLSEQGPEMAVLPAAIPYFFYFCLFVIPAGFFPLFWLCCGCSPCLSDKMIETLRSASSPNTEKLLQSIDEMARASPSLTLHVECYHNRTVHYTERERQSDGSYKNVSKTRTEKITTFRGYRRVPIIRWKDLSPPSVVVADVVDQCPSNIISVNYKHVYELHPAQSNLIDLLRQNYYYTHCMRDDHCAVTLNYDISVPKRDVDVVVKEKNCGYWTSQILFFNPISFFLWMYLTLLLPIAMVFRTFVRPIPFSSAKYLHIDNPNPSQDVVTYNSPRWVLRWSWY